jgi:hypothetical protein
MIYIDDDDLRAAGFRVSRAEGLDDLPAVSYPTATPPGGSGEIITADVRTVSPRTGRILLVSNHPTLATFEAAMHVLRDKLNRRSFVLRSLTRTGQRITARPTRGVAINVPTGLIRAPFKWQQDIPLICDHPWWEDIDEQVVAFTSTPVEVPCGTEPHYCTLKVTGPAVDPVFTHRDSGGTVLHTLAPTVTLLTGEWWSLNMWTGVAQQFIGGILSDALDTLPTDFELFPFDRLNGDYATEAWGTIEVSAGTGESRGRRQWG